MDDYNLSTIIESKNEWCARLTNTLTPCIIEGLRSVFDEAYNVCIENEEESKYLMTFQNFLNNIPKWSSEIVDTETQRIITSSACNYLEDLLSCVHITQLKSLTSTRVGLKQKKINIDIPDLGKFIHKTYINVARKVYVNIYLFEKDIKPLQIQKNNRELELIIKECILNTIRESIPIEHILQIYLDETQETDVEVEEKKELVPDKEAIEKNKKYKISFHRPMFGSYCRALYKWQQISLHPFPRYINILSFGSGTYFVYFVQKDNPVLLHCLDGCSYYFILI